MKLDAAIDLVNALQDNGFEAETYEDYSGRGMYGETTTGVVSDITPNTIPEFLNTRYNIDNMGKSDYIYY